MRESDMLSMAGTQASRSPWVVRVPMAAFITSMPGGGQAHHGVSQV